MGHYSWEVSAVKPTRAQMRNPWFDTAKGRGRRFPCEWHARTKKERAIGHAIAGCESVKDLAIRLRLVEQWYGTRD
jgi:hypothetical protein